MSVERQPEHEAEGVPDQAPERVPEQAPDESSGTQEEVVPDQVRKEVERKVSEAEQALMEGIEEHDPVLHTKPDERIDIKVCIHYSKLDGSIMAINTSDITSNDWLRRYNVVGYREFTFTFTVPTYDRFADFRRASSVFSRELDGLVVDRLKLRNWYLVFHLVKTDYPLVDVDGNAVELVRRAADDDDDRAAGIQPLTSESIDAVHRIKSAVLEVVLIAFERAAMLNL